MAVIHLPPPPTAEDDYGWLRDLTPEQIERLVELTPPAERAGLVEALEALESERAPWVPMPHQIPPPLDQPWFGWLMMGGRGAGKTAAVAHVMDDHANGPPCLPGKVPHRMGIIAPTLGDASASIVHGDDGLAVINPEVREVTRKGGTVVLWPNGTEAFLFGVNTLNDVDRLRAKGNRPAAIGTPIETEHGPKPIELVQVGERVWTSHGLRPVIRTWTGPPKVLWRIETAGGRTIHVSPEHEVWTGRGWQPAHAVLPGDRLTSWSGEVTAGSGSDRIGPGLRATAIPPLAGSGGAQSSSTGRSTSTTTGQSPRDGTSTTTTRTRPTTRRRTSSPYPRQSTTPSTPAVGTGMQPGAEHRSQAEQYGHRASSVGSRPGDLTLVSVPRHAGDWLSGPTGARCGHVLCASALSPPSGHTARGEALPRLAPDRVVTSSLGSIAVPTADLTVAGDHEFIAAGLLVANCFDLREEVAAWRYLRDGMEQADFGLRKGVARWIGATTPRPRPTIRKLDTDPKVVVVTAETDANQHLSAERRAALYEAYGNTRVGLQELKGIILEEVSGALWSQDQIDQFRVSPDEVPPLTRVRTYVDPSWGTTNDECGIVVVGRARNGHAYILEDLSRRTTPSEWGRLAALGRLPSQEELDATDEDGRPIPPEARLWYGRASEKVIAEGNFQGEQVRLVMKLTSRDLHRRISFGLVHASKGKRLRAEPVQALYEQGRVHHVGQLPGLEFQLLNWIPPEAGEDAGDPGDPAMMEGGEGEPESSKWSPDRLDAMVFGVTDLVLGSGSNVGRMEVADGRLPNVGGSGRTAGPGRIPTATRQAQMYHEQTGKTLD